MLPCSLKSIAGRQRGQNRSHKRGFDLRNEHESLFAINTAIDTPKKHAHAFLLKKWLLVEASKGNHFLIADYTPALQNTTNREGPYGNIGPAVSRH